MTSLPIDPNRVITKLSEQIQALTINNAWLQAAVEQMNEQVNEAHAQIVNLKDQVAQAEGGEAKKTEAKVPANGADRP